MATVLVNGRVIIGNGIAENICVTFDGERITSISTDPPAGAEVIDLEGQLLLPGFIDVQVNGGGGRLFNDDPSVDTIEVIAKAHRRFGTTSLLPTLISDDFSIIERGIAAVSDAIDAGVPGVLGIHIEGPFLNKRRRGIHLESMLQPFGDQFIDLLSAARNGRTLVTIAPECVPPAKIREMVEAGVIVSGGHSDADYETVRAAIDAGMTGFTHLFNGMSQLVNRAPGMVGAALEDRSTFAGVIVDGHHIHPASFRIAIAAKGIERLMLVTDAMATVGAKEDDFLLQGRKIHLEGDRLVSEDGTLAGSTLSMAAALANAIEQGRLTLGAAIQMATSSPAHFLGLGHETGAIAPGMRSDLILMRDDLTIVRSWIGGIENI